MVYPYEDSEPSICRLCGKDISERQMVKICHECIRLQQQDIRGVPGAKYGRDKSNDPSV